MVYFSVKIILFLEMSTEGVSSEWVKKTGLLSSLSEWAVMYSEDKILIRISYFKSSSTVCQTPGCSKNHGVNRLSNLSVQLIFSSKLSLVKNTDLIYAYLLYIIFTDTPKSIAWCLKRPFLTGKALLGSRKCGHLPANHLKLTRCAEWHGDCRTV